MRICRFRNEGEIRGLAATLRVAGTSSTRGQLSLLLSHAAARSVNGPGGSKGRGERVH
jgi:hypothetical protein